MQDPDHVFSSILVARYNLSCFVFHLLLYLLVKSLYINVRNGAAANRGLQMSLTGGQMIRTLDL